jgi:uncharacterized protein YegJ (DUF2314 family)
MLAGRLAGGGGGAVLAPPQEGIMNVVRLIGLLVIAVTALLCGPVGAQTAQEELGFDEIFALSKDDPDIKEAMREARAGFPNFFALAQSPKPSTRMFAVVVAISYGDNDIEYVWVVPLERKGDKYAGRLTRTPRAIKNINEGDVITFSENEVADWVYVENGTIKGIFTVCAFLRREPREEVEPIVRRSRMDCRL